MRPRTPTGPHGLSCAAGRLARALKVGMTRLRPPTVIAMVAGIVARAIGNAVTPLPARRCADVLGAVCGRGTGEGGACGWRRPLVAGAAYGAPPPSFPANLADWQPQAQARYL